MTPEQLKDPSYRPVTGDEWEEWIWNHLKDNPGKTCKQVAAANRYLTESAASGYLHKLTARDMLAGKKFPNSENGTAREILHYTIACAEFVPMPRKRNKSTRPPQVPFSFDHVDPPIAIIHETVKRNRTKTPKPFSPEDFVKPLSIAQGRELYDYLHQQYGARS